MGHVAALRHLELPRHHDQREALDPPLRPPDQHHPRPPARPVLRPRGPPSTAAARWSARCRARAARAEPSARGRDGAGPARSAACPAPTRASGTPAAPRRASRSRPRAPRPARCRPACRRPAARRAAGRQAPESANTVLSRRVIGTAWAPGSDSIPYRGAQPWPGSRRRVKERIDVDHDRERRRPAGARRGRPRGRAGGAGGRLPRLRPAPPGAADGRAQRRQVRALRGPPPAPRPALDRPPDRLLPGRLGPVLRRQRLPDHRHVDRGTRPVDDDHGRGPGARRAGHAAARGRRLPRRHPGPAAQDPGQPLRAGVGPPGSPPARARPGLPLDPAAAPLGDDRGLPARPHRRLRQDRSATAGSRPASPRSRSWR